MKQCLVPNKFKSSRDMLEEIRRPNQGVGYRVLVTPKGREVRILQSGNGHFTVMHSDPDRTGWGHSLSARLNIRGDLGDEYLVDPLDLYASRANLKQMRNVPTGSVVGMFVGGVLISTTTIVPVGSAKRNDRYTISKRCGSVFAMIKEGESKFIIATHATLSRVSDLKALYADKSSSLIGYPIIGELPEWLDEGQLSCGAGPHSLKDNTIVYGKVAGIVKPLRYDTVAEMLYVEGHPPVRVKRSHVPKKGTYNLNCGDITVWLIAGTKEIQASSVNIVECMRGALPVHGVWG